ncbi:hypothetical protein GCM10009718_21990 [Isoptericola halotolerans]|uniref:Transcriptional regulator, AbiEi antitoxin, Type IV TA system n=1 Tax=Isoptericola halotolerans TaxID=300560 RepID=A0ABX2AA08_9MICO|nr:hypothetical protein [Isoptericola halotolerans]NOV98867.1 hypothetical protein [Isoptericola halotolerans]
MSTDILAALPSTFRYSQARERLNERQFRKLVDAGQIIAIARGLYRKRGLAGDDDLIEIASRAPDATLCLRSALAHHDLIDDIPAEIDIAIPRGAWTPSTEAPVRWRHFDTKTFAIGRGLLDIGDESTIGLYSPERSVIDAFRMRNIEGPELANEALKRWLRSGGQPSELLRTARHFPRALTPLRRTMEILL